MTVPPFAQAQYQVRSDWGVAALTRVAPTDVVVVIDVLRFTSVVSQRVSAGGTVDVAEMKARSINGAVICEVAAALEHAPLVLAGSLRNASAIADAIVRLQHERGGRVNVLIVAGGERESRDPDAHIRFALEDQLGAGAIIAALSQRGIDNTSPEAAAAGETFTALRQALRHLVAASGSGRELQARDEHDINAMATELDADLAVPQLVDGLFVAR